MSYARYITYLVLASSLSLGGFFDNSTIYTSASMATPYVNDKLELEDDYKYTFGIRKIALFPYQVKSNFYKGNEKHLSDNVIKSMETTFEKWKPREKYTLEVV